MSSSGYGRRSSPYSVQRASAQTVTRKLAERAGGEAFGNTSAGEFDARPRGEAEKDVERVEGTKIAFVVPPVIRRW